MEKGQWLMEVKAEKTIPLWLSQKLSEHGMYRTSFSKYGNEYKQLLKSKINQPVEHIPTEKESILYA